MAVCSTPSRTSFVVSGTSGLKDFWPEERFFYHGQDAEIRASSFIANLYPSPQTLLDSYTGFFESLFARPAREAGMDRWGTKTVRYSADHAYFLRWLVPDAKFIFLVRNPYNAFRSYDTIRRERGVLWYNRWPDHPLDAKEFGKHWRSLTASFLEYHEALGARLLFYEDLVEGRCDHEGLEKFLGMPIDREALKANPGASASPQRRSGPSAMGDSAGRGRAAGRTVGIRSH